MSHSQSQLYNNLKNDLYAITVQKKILVDSLNARGIEASMDETLESLASKCAVAGVVDQHYNPESISAQSGTAVAEGIEDHNLSAESHEDIRESVSSKQDKLTSANAGQNISITEENGIVKINSLPEEVRWGEITGEITSQTDLVEYIDENGGKIDSIKVNGVAQQIVDKTVDISVPTDLSQLNSDTNHRVVTDNQIAIWDAKQNAITNLATIEANAEAGKDAKDTIDTYGDIVTHNAAEFASASQGAKADTALQPNDNVSELTNDADYTTKTYVDNADNNLQEQIDAIASSSDVVDVVGTYAELQLYDTSKLKNNDIVKVLQDNTHDDAITYYRWVINSQTHIGAWDYIGLSGPYYTKSETDVLLDSKQDTINSNNKLPYSYLQDAPVTSIAEDPDSNVYKINNKFIAATFDDNLNNIAETYENKTNKVTSLSEHSTDEQYPSAKCVYDQLLNKQNTLISGVNIKTINQQSLLEAGNLEVASVNYSNKSSQTLADASSECVVTLNTPSKDILCEFYVGIDEDDNKTRPTFVIEGQLEETPNSWLTLLDYTNLPNSDLLSFYKRSFTVSIKLSKIDSTSSIVKVLGIENPSSSSTFYMSNFSSQPIYSTIKLTNIDTAGFSAIRIRAVNHEDTTKQNSSYIQTPTLNGISVGNSSMPKTDELTYFIYENDQQSYWSSSKTKFKLIEQNGLNKHFIGWGNNGAAGGAQDPLYFCYRYFDDIGAITDDGFTLKFNSYKPYWYESAFSRNPIECMIRKSGLPFGDYPTPYLTDWQYHKGDYILYSDNKIYECIKQPEIGSFDASCWKAVSTSLAPYSDIASERTSCIWVVDKSECWGYRYMGYDQTPCFDSMSLVSNDLDYFGKCQFGIGLSGYRVFGQVDTTTKFLRGVPVLKFDTYEGVLSLVESSRETTATSGASQYNTLQNNIIVSDWLKYEALSSYDFNITFGKYSEDYYVKLTIKDNNTILKELIGIVDGNAFRSCGFCAGHNQHTYVTIFGTIDREYNIVSGTYQTTIGSQLILSGIEKKSAMNFGANTSSIPTITAYYN